MRLFPVVAGALFLAACAAQAAPSRVVPQAARDLVQVRLKAHWTKTSIGSFGDPYGVAVHPHCTGSCEVFVSDPGHKAIYVVRPDGSRSPVGDFSAAGSTFDPQGIALGHDGSIFVADKAPGGESYVYYCGGGGCVAQRLPASYAIFPLYNRGVANYYHYHFTTGLNHATYAAQATNHPLTTQGKVTCVKGVSCLFRSHTFSDPYDIAVDQYNSPVIVDARDKKAYRVTASGANDLGMTFVDPYGIAVTADGQYVYVADAGAKKVYQRSPDGVWSEIGTFADPYAVAVTADRTVYVADHGDRNVYRLTAP